MVLLIGDASITLQRGTLRTSTEPEDAGTRAHAGAGGGENIVRMPDSGRSAAGTGGMSGSPGGAGGSSTAGTGGAGASGSGGMRTPDSRNTAGGGGSSADAGSPSDAGQRDASAGRGSDASAAGSGDDEPAAGSGGAGTAGSDPAPTAGTGAAYPVGPPDITGRRWDCINLLGFCDCIAYPESEGGGRSCSQKLPCCYTDLDSDKPQCICEAAQSGGGCYVFGTDARRPSVDWCPGQSD
jgi:hypothetical protein